MTDRDLTPAEARAEIEAFMGEGWEVQAYCHWPDDTPSKIRTVRCEQVHADGIELKFSYTTYRAAVDALKQAWREAVRPWCLASALAGYKLAESVDNETCADVVARVLKEDSNG